MNLTMDLLDSQRNVEESDSLAAFFIRLSVREHRLIGTFENYVTLFCFTSIKLLREFDKSSLTT